MFTTLYIKGSHALTVVEDGDRAKVSGLSGWIDAIELMTMLIADGYRIAG